jgi:hypothetical protein
MNERHDGHGVIRSGLCFGFATAIHLQRKK